MLENTALVKLIIIGKTEKQNKKESNNLSLFSPKVSVILLFP